MLGSGDWCWGTKGFDQAIEGRETEYTSGLWIRELSNFAQKLYISFFSAIMVCSSRG